MNFAAYIDGLNRSAQNLPGVLHGWAEFDAALRSHFAEALTEQLLVSRSVQSSVSTPEQRAQLQQAWARFVGVVVRHAGDIEFMMGLNALELLTPLSVSSTALGPDAFDATDSLPLAA